eukprot:5884391-Pyramimonas_sp.AAC.1
MSAPASRSSVESVVRASTGPNGCHRRHARREILLAYARRRAPSGRRALETIYDKMDVLEVRVGRTPPRRT